MLYYVYFSNAGVPATGLTPTWYAPVVSSSSSSAGLYSAGTTSSAVGSPLAGPTIYPAGAGWYKFNITFGTAPWTATTEDLVGVIDGGATLADSDRYKPVVISLRGLALARIGHKGEQSKQTGDVTIYQTDGSTAELKLDMTDTTTSITRNPVKP